MWGRVMCMAPRIWIPADLGHRSRLRLCLAAGSDPWMGSLSSAVAGFGRLVWLDVVGCEAWGLGSLPLWPLVLGGPGFGWGWYPGMMAYGTMAPALVGFFGFGGRGMGVGFGFGNVGWVPLHRNEMLYPCGAAAIPEDSTEALTLPMEISQTYIEILALPTVFPELAEQTSRPVDSML